MAFEPRKSRVTIWDVTVGLFMILSSLLIQAVFLAMFAALLQFIFKEYAGWTLPMLPIFIALAIIFNAAAFYDFHRRRAYNWGGYSQSFHMLPRGIHRIRTGYDS